MTKWQKRKERCFNGCKKYNAVSLHKQDLGGIYNNGIPEYTMVVGTILSIFLLILTVFFLGAQLSKVGDFKDSNISSISCWSFEYLKTGGLKAMFSGTDYANEVHR